MSGAHAPEEKGTRDGKARAFVPQRLAPPGKIRAIGKPRLKLAMKSWETVLNAESAREIGNGPAGPVPRARSGSNTTPHASSRWTTRTTSHAYRCIMTALG